MDLILLCKNEPFSIHIMGISVCAIHFKTNRQASDHPDNLFTILVTAHTPSIEQRIIEAEEVIYLQDLVNHLPLIFREVTYLHFYHQLTLEQIARLLNTPAPIITKRLNVSLYLIKIIIEDTLKA